MRRVPDEGKVLPPPGIVNVVSVWLGGCGYFSALLDNALKRKPALKSGVHRQVLLVTIGWFLGYHMKKYENYVYAKRDRDMNAYIKLYPNDFIPKEKKTFAEIVEPFTPVR
ncbi:NADH dehydrogenase [ubiquinone] 1 subunit C2 [Nerophis ophidion]|uniref:NADH dehydrogenase [ubiquinone] 1 subunit C2 n=1 Tax=Nerophis ophidion TaxID=159077 RepID=UPI002ADFBA45|nr:NADH dehydrogenase [ubiquinone] 1 subunit C2 [Nerophis ophidion]